VQTETMIRLAIRVQREDSELVLAELLTLVPAGVEEVDVDACQLEYVIYGAPGELPALPDLQAAAGAALVQVSSSEIADDWADRWRSFHRPLRLGRRLTVRPPWVPPQGTELDVVIDPGRAFGTGAHATTRMCLELLLALPPAWPAGGSPLVVDLGCGSGVLGITAAKLGLGHVLALDNDPPALQATIANAATNGVSLEVRRHDLRVADAPPARLVVANLLGPLLETWAARLRAARDLVPVAAIVGGLLADEADRLTAAFAAAGMREQRRELSGEWAALLLVGGGAHRPGATPR
jgi:ribosomal protein L11 methyltransferase